MMEQLSSPMATTFALTLLHFLWQGLLVAFLYGCLLQALPLRSTSHRYTIGVVMFVLLSLCPPATFAILQHSAAHSTAAHDRPVRSLTTLPISSTFSGVANSPTSTSILSATTTDSLTPAVTTSRLHLPVPFLLLLWSAGMIVSGARLLAGFVNVLWLRQGRFAIALPLATRCQHLAQRLNMEPAQVFGSLHIREAAVVGFWKPIILLPSAWLMSLPPNVLEAVIAHELAHLRRHDVWINLYQRIVETLLFYHPAVWWLSNRIRMDREMACDELAVVATGDAGQYVRALEQIGRWQLRGTPSLAPSFTGDRKMKLLSRVQNVLHRNTKPEREPAWLVGLVAVLLPLLFVVVHSFPMLESKANAQDEGGFRSAEAEAGARRSPEGERDRARPEGRPQEGEAMNGFKPQTPREAALFQMILKLQRDVASLQRQVPSRSGERESRGGDFRFRDREMGERTQSDQTRNWQQSKAGQVFKAYDKNSDNIVSLEEWLAMTNGNISPARRELQTERFQSAEPSKDGKFTPSEFIQWYTKDRFDTREGNRDAEARSSGDRERERSSGEREREAGERPTREGGAREGGAREGDRGRGGREGERPGPRDRE